MTIDELYKYLKLITPVGCRVFKEPFAYLSDTKYFSTVESIHVSHVEPRDRWYVTITDVFLYKSKRGALMAYFQAMHLPTWFTTAFKLRLKPNEKFIFYVTPRF